MRAYLENFMKEFEYKENDAKFLLQEYDKIQSNWSAKSLFNKVIEDYEK